ncbi:hypothetical protein P170DRAFT_446038 [Aspergillus steynii IBT 23096]|uniref:Xylanolytic transcriptional activator regulatory domain-containing protein n=1 Tax=Aspergillus steynii IBT 23096 TaxID=1392250 RepID=A0A2I2GDA1_9EURO|nr:uncharacterized protein P170DRAFT_446038 [Aspergillus steynii IBT 23096]PLB50797.1 hypothetical protein P170DRAFT_446038 [Aspergillus steynii IBT 23096]
MPKVGRPSKGPHEIRACTECRCSGSSPCSYCSRTRKICQYGLPPSRTPLTRKNLDASEARCSALISLISSIKPDIDIAAALNGLTGNSERHSTTSLETSNVLDSDVENTALSDRYEWRETSLTTPLEVQNQKSPLDGMASLPTGDMESGYLGDSSGVTLLRTISDLIPENTGSRDTRQETTSPANNQTGSPVTSSCLANTATLESLVDGYFMWYNPSYPVLHEKTFREKYQLRHQIPPRSSWHTIFFLVLAIGDWILTDGSEAERSGHYTAARSRMSMRMLESGTLLNVQAFLLMVTHFGNYLQKRDRPNTGYNFIGIAYRMAIGLGLHREPPRGATRDTLYNERRRVIWWIVYCFDSGFSLTTGRPLSISDSFIETRLPRNIDDSAYTLASNLPPPIEQPTIYSAIIAQARLASIGNAVFSKLISSTDKSSWDLKTSRTIDYQFKAWKLSLPAYFTASDVPNWFRGPRAMVLWKEQNLRMMLWWGSQRKCTNLDREEAQNMCHFTAVETIQEITGFISSHTQTTHTGLSWYATYFLFQATVVLSIYHLRPTQPLDTGLVEVTQELWLSSISRSRDCLASLSTRNKAAMRCLQVLDRIRDRSLSSQTISPSQPNYQSDSVQMEPMSHNPEEHAVPLAVDPTLQIFFEDSTWDNDIFEGLNGFPSTGEIGAFDYMTINNDARTDI